MKAKINLHVDNAPVLNESWMILKPSQELLDVKPQSYYPKLVTIGPLYQNLQSSRIDSYKAISVKKFMDRHGISAVEDLIQDLISTQPHELSHIYNLNLPQSEFEWLQLLVTVDTVFIHELLLCMWPPEHMNTVRYITTFLFNDPTLGVRLVRDLLLIGNQIPMSFLKKISNNRDFSFADLEKSLRKFIVQRNPFFLSQGARSRFLQFLESQDIKLIDTCEHLLDSLYFSCTAEEESMRQSNSEECGRKSVYSCFSFLRKLWACRKTKKLETQEVEFVRLPTASELSKTGISFKACEGNISVIKYDKRKLQLHLPRLVLFNSTEILLRNLIAHEITSKKQGEFLTYAVIMDSIIDTEEDLAILTKAKVIENHLGKNIRVVEMWNDMCTNVCYTNDSERWKAVVPVMMAHYLSHWRRLYAECHERFFSRPWLWISVVAAFILLLTSILQTGYSIAGYYKNT